MPEQKESNERHTSLVWKIIGVILVSVLIVVILYFVSIAFLLQAP